MEKKNMNPVLWDPDIKINMSLDEIIRLTREDISSELQRRNPRNMKKYKSARRRGNVFGRDHSVSLMSSLQGNGACMAKKGLLSVENKRSIAQFVSNREMNSELIEQSKEIIPAEYKLVKTGHGVERVLVPSLKYNINPKKKLLLPRQLSMMECPCNSSGLELYSDSPNKPPPLINAPIYEAPKSSLQTADPDDEIVILDSPSPGRHQQEVIDVESNLPVDVVEMKKLFMPGVGEMSQSGFKTLNDRFTLLIGNPQF